MSEENKEKIHNKSEIEKLIKEAQNKDSLDKAIELMEKNNLIKDKNYCKEILKIAFKEKGTALIKILCKKFNINLKSEEEDSFLNELIDAALYNTSRKPETVFAFLLEEFPEKINELDINKLFKVYKNNKKNIILERFFIEHLNENNFQNLETEGKKDLIYSIIKYDSSDLFKKVYDKDKYKDELDNIIEKIYLFGKEKDKMIEFVIDNNNFSKNLLEILLRKRKVNVILLNKIISKTQRNKDNLGTDFKIKNEKIKKEELNNEGQGKNQSIISEREIKYSTDNSGKILSVESITDTVIANLKDGTEKKLYEVIYDAEGNQEIIYYEEDKNTILAIIKIDNNGKLEFPLEKKGKKATYDLNKIEKILNDDYKSIDAFDNKLSYLSYIPLKDNENIIFETNCKSIEDIVEIVQNNKNPKTVVICDFAIDKHNVQIVIKNKKLNILNTSPNFEYIRKKIEEKCNGIEVKQIKIMEQSEKNCVEASKLYTVVLAEKYKQNFGNLKKLSERLNKFQKFMEDILNKTEEEQADHIKESEETKKEYNENIKMLKTVLETKIELFNKYKKHFKDSVEKLDKIELKCEMIGILNLRNEINNELNKNNKKYKKIIEYIVENSKENSKNKENKLKDLRLSRILLIIIKYNICVENIKIVSNNNRNITENVNKILKNKEKKETRQIFLDCIQEIGNLTEDELRMI